MPKFFVNQSQINEGYVSILGEDAHHISRSLRMAEGEHITVSDMQKNEYDCVLEAFLDGCIKAKIQNVWHTDTEPDIKVHLFQALPKGEKLDFIIQKSVECGVYDITPFESERCVVRCKSDSEERKKERRNKIALEAAKQCGRGMIPAVNSTLSFDKILSEASKSDAVLFCYEGEGTKPLGKALAEMRSKEKEIKDISVIIGSEGGFSLDEAAKAERLGFLKIGLGKRILRTETAAIFALSCLVYEFELS